MKVTIHGPQLADQSQGTYRVHAEKSPDNKHEVKLNGSVHPDESVEVTSREDVVDHVYPADEYQREPDDLPMYLADIYFGASCADLPIHAEPASPTEEEDSTMTDDPARLTEARDIYIKTNSYRAVGRKMGISPTTARKLVEMANAAEAAKAPKRSTRSHSLLTGATAVDPDATRTCTYKYHEGPNPLPATEENFAIRKSGERAGTFVGWCRACSKKYSQGYASQKKAEAAAAPPTTNGDTAPATPEPVAAA